MDLATKAAIDRLRKIAQHGPALMSVSREDAQRILAELDGRPPARLPVIVHESTPTGRYGWVACRWESPPVYAVGAGGSAGPSRG